MNKTNPSTQANSEIDLLQILDTVWKTLSKVTNITFVFFVRKLHWFAVVALVALLVSFASYKIKVPIYSCTIPVQMNVLGNDYAIDFINQLPDRNDTISFKNVMIEILHLPDTIKIFDIKQVSAHWGFDINRDGLVDVVDINNKFIKSRPDSLRKVRIENKFFVYIEVYNKNIIPYIEKGLSHIFDNNTYVQQHNDVRIQQTKARIDKVTEQLNRLDSMEFLDYFRNKYELGNAGKNNTVAPIMILNEKQRELFHSQIIECHNQRLAMEAQLELYSDPITIISTSNGIAKQVVTFASIAKPILTIAFVFTFLAALIWVNRRWLKQAIFLE